MKINSLEITAFGPFKETQKIDFNALSVDGLFMLEGPTGSGKSSIIDAIVWALYNTTAHQAATDKASTSYGKRVRSDYASVDEETKVILEFTAGGSQYRIERTAAYEGQKARGEGTRLIPASARLIFIGKEREALTKIDEISREVYDILHMNADQFSQLVILPQGDFASFLHSSSDQREEVLKRIFKTKFYEDISMYFEKQRKYFAQLQIAARNEVSRHAKNLLDEIGNQLPAFEGKKFVDFLADDNEPSAKKLSELSEVITQIQPDVTKDTTEEDSLSKKIIPLRSEKDGLEKDVAAIAEKAKATSKLAALVAQSDDIAEIESQLKLANKADSLSSKLDALTEAEEKRDKAYKVLDEEVEEKTPEWVKARIKKLEEEEKKLIAQLAKYEDIDEELERLSDQIDDSAEIEESIKSLPGIKTKVDAAGKKVAAQKAKIVAYKAKQKDGYAHLIKLVKGKPCPVCGSAEHPNPVKGKGIFAESVLQELEDEQEVFQKNLRNLESDLRIATDKSKKKFEPSAKLKEKQKSLSAAKTKIDKLEDDKFVIEQELKLYKDNVQHLIDYLANSKSAELAEKKLEQAMIAAGIEDIEILEELLDLDKEELNDQISTYREKLNATKALLAQKTWQSLPEPDALKGKLETISTNLKALEAQLLEVQKRLAQSAGTQERLDRITAGIETGLESLATIALEAAPFLHLDGWAGGNNKFHLKLTNYVLQERLELILERASVILRKISHGKYEFRLNEEKVGKQKTAGLGITILDCHTGYERPAETLSGGETFYASLALALGLADVIKADQGGIELGTLFIDEGFGSLSDDTLEEVRIVLEDLRSADRIIGIVSHVEGMKTQIPLRLEVRRPTLTGPSKVRIAVLGQI